MTFSAKMSTYLSLNIISYAVSRWPDTEFYGTIILRILSKRTQEHVTEYTLRFRFIIYKRPLTNRPTTENNIVYKK